MWQEGYRALDTVQNFIDFSLDWLEQRGYSLTIDTDMGAWVRVMAAAVTTAANINPTFDPSSNRLSPHNSFWLDAKAGSHTIATCAARHFVTEDYLSLMRSTRLWFDPPRPGDAELALTLPPDMPLIRGSVGHEGDSGSIPSIASEDCRSSCHTWLALSASSSGQSTGRRG